MQRQHQLLIDEPVVGSHLLSVVFVVVRDVAWRAGHHDVKAPDGQNEQAGEEDPGGDVARSRRNMLIIRRRPPELGVGRNGQHKESAAAHQEEREDHQRLAHLLARPRRPALILLVLN